MKKFRLKLQSKESPFTVTVDWDSIDGFSYEEQLQAAYQELNNSWYTGADMISLVEVRNA